jgi:hypothetical protein
MKRRKEENGMARNKDKWNEETKKPGIRKERNGIEEKEIRMPKRQKGNENNRNTLLIFHTVLPIPCAFRY